MNKQTFMKIYRKVKFGVNIPLKVFKKPIYPESVTSDLFPIRNDENWLTEFEFLNLPGLIQGEISNLHKALMIFFNKNGSRLGQVEIDINQIGRKTIILEELLKDELSESATFSVFHKRDSDELNIDGSFIAERGYVGYKNNDKNIKGYVHGNLDAVAFYKNKIQMLGNIGLFRKTYLVQHVLTGPAIYDFLITNPTRRKKVFIVPRIRYSKHSTKLKKLRIPSRGVEKLTVKIPVGETAVIQLKSRLYLARPVVFRSSTDSFDVFHG